MQKNLEEIIGQAILQKNQDKQIEEEFSFIEDDEKDKEEICQEIIKEFLENEKLELLNLKKNKKMLKKLIKILKEENKISYRMIGKYLGISRENIRRLMIV